MTCICLFCMLHGSTHYYAIGPRALSRHIGDFLGSRRMETAPTSIEVLLRPTLGQSDEPSDLRESLSSTTQHRCTHVLMYTTPGSPRSGGGGEHFHTWEYWGCAAGQGAFLSFQLWHRVSYLSFRNWDRVLF